VDAHTLASGPQDTPPQIAPTWLNADGSLNSERLLNAFLAFGAHLAQVLPDNLLP
jgi:hypothetical protein